MKYYNIIDVLKLMRKKVFPDLHLLRCIPDGGEEFTVFANNHGLFLDAGMRSEDEFFEYYALEDSLDFKFEIPKFESISLMRGCNRLIILRDDIEKECVVYSDGRRISFRDLFGQFNIIEPLFRYDKEKMINIEVSFDSSRVNDDFFDCSFLTEEEELALINNDLPRFYELIERRGLCNE